jgi:hypothetical protein
LVFGIWFKFCSYGHWRTQCLYSTKVKMLCRKSVVIPMRSCTLPFFFFNDISGKCSTYSKIFCFLYAAEDVDLWILMQNEVQMLIYGF